MVRVVDPGHTPRPRAKGSWFPLFGFLASAFNPPRWLWVSAVLLAVFYWFGFPHLRVQYGFIPPRESNQYTWCEYWGPTHAYRKGGNPDLCPLIEFQKTQSWMRGNGA